MCLYGDPNLPRKVVQNVINFIHDFLISVFIPSLKKDILLILKRENISNSILYEINQCFDQHSTIFESVETESKQFQLLRQRGFIDFKKLTIGTSLEETIVENDILLVPKTVHGVYIPLRESLKFFLEIPGLFNQILDYIKKLMQESNILTNIMQGDLWINKYSNDLSNDIFLPLYIFFDDLEVGNPLGSHAGANKFAAIYASIACLPPHIASRLDSILFSSLMYSSDKVKF